MSVINLGLVSVEHGGYWWIFQDCISLRHFLNSASVFVHPDCYWMVLK